MKSKKIIACIAALALGTQVAAVSGCSSISSEGFNMPDIKYTTYDNADFSQFDYSTNGYVKSENLPDQWENYGAGDPYIFRFNGTYYLYVSTRDDKMGVMAWKSSDLIHWTKCGNNGMVFDQGDLQYEWEGNIYDCIGAYAPEVYYFNGKFYMYTSPGGNGHYTLVSDSPEGPFKKLIGNYGCSIDGSVFIDDDESMYFLNAERGGIEIRTLESLGAYPEYAAQLSSTSMGWTEGPMMIKRNGIYYLTYTGINVTSPAYRVCYATEKDGNSLTKGYSFTPGTDNPLILTVDSEFNGLGHSSTVLGPDMDSYYIAYHSLNMLAQTGPWRSLNIDRLTFNGTQMSVDESKTNSIAANLPAFSAQNTDTLFTAEGGKTISTQSTGKVFTAEYNFKGDSVKCIAGYADANNYIYAVVNYAEHKIELHQVSGGSDSLIKGGTLKNDFNAGVVHTVRIAYADGVADVYFDNMCKIPNAKLSVSAGKIGYEGGTEHLFTAFSNVARGYSDRIELKQSGSVIGSSTYLPDGAYEGVTSYKLSNKSGLSTVTVDEDEYYDDMPYDGAYQLTFGKSGDFARYATYFREGGHYGLALTYDTRYCGRTIGIQANNGEVQNVRLPKVDAGEGRKIVTAFVGEFDVEAGANIISIYGGEKAVGFISFTMQKKAYGNFTFEKSLKEVVTEGAIYSSMFRQTDEGHATRSGNQMLVYFGDGTISNCEMEVQMKFTSVNTYSAGIVLRANNYATSNNDDAQSIQAYYLGIDSQTITLSKYNYNYSSDFDFDSHGLGDDFVGHWFTIKTVINGNTITVSIDGKQVFKATDAQPLLTGYLGLYSQGAEVVYRNLKIKGI